MNREARIALAIIGIIVIPGGVYAAISAKLLTKICANLYSFKLISVNGKEIKLNLVVQVKNPARVDLNIEGYDFDILINDTPIGKIASREEKVIAANEVSFITIPITISPDQFISKVDWGNIVANFISGRSDKILVSLSGKLLGGIFKIPISTKINIKKSLLEISQISKQPTEAC